ncbi:MAG TPA: hypothetical protein VGQ59_21060 [Cyclobacteriaceae bacterium]|jgi:hypothetical protein|nr:hypothetical protein [Cyclobacteriaceae bacterium]
MIKRFCLLTATLFTVNLIGYSQSHGTDDKLKFVQFETIKSIRELNVKKMEGAHNHTAFLGKDTSIYDLALDSTNTIPYEYFFQAFTNPNAKEIEKNIFDAHLEIIVDTSNSIAISFYPDDLPGDQITDWVNRNKENVVAYPVYIWNSTDITTSIPMQGSATEMIQEARDETGNWQPIEYFVYGFCGNGYWDYIVKPGYFFITSIYKYTGDYQTELRVKFRRQDLLLKCF